MSMKSVGLLRYMLPVSGIYGHHQVLKMMKCALIYVRYRTVCRNGSIAINLSYTSIFTYRYNILLLVLITSVFLDTEKVAQAPTVLTYIRELLNS
jgi:hypothetical protein